MLVETVGRGALDDREHTEGYERGEVQEFAGADPDAVVLREEKRDHGSVLLADLAREFREHPRRHPEVDPDVEDVPDPGAAAGGDHDLVVPGEFADLLHQRVNDRPPVIDDAVAADLDHVQVGHDPDLPDIAGRAEQAVPDQALTLESRSHLKTLCHG